MWYRPDLMLENSNARPRIKENFTVDKKILVQQVAQGITATLDKQKYLCHVTLNVIFETKKDYTMEFILCLLNSSLVNAWFKQTYPTGLHFTINQLEAIPVPAISPDEQKPFVELADKMLSLKDQDEWQEYFDEYKAEISALKADIDATDKAINAAVYALYGLTAEEIAAVEENSNAKS